MRIFSIVVWPLTMLAALTVTFVQAMEHSSSKRASIVPEAKQPKGFPPPGPVGEVIVKEYPAYRAATTRSQERRQNSMFRSLFRHIQSNEIAMTAPVEMTYRDGKPETMAFLYATPETGELGTSGVVDVVDLPPAKVLSIGVRGSYTNERFEKNRKELEAWLDKNSDKWRAAGQARFFGFNSPFVPGLLKYGEVQIPIEPVGDSKRK